VWTEFKAFWCWYLIPLHKGPFQNRTYLSDTHGAKEAMLANFFLPNHFRVVLLNKFKRHYNGSCTHILNHYLTLKFSSPRSVLKMLNNQALNVRKEDMSPKESTRIKKTRARKIHGGWKCKFEYFVYDRYCG
jgi:hypothetical protein